MSLTLKLALSPLLVAQALLTRQRLPRLHEPQGPRDGVVGRGPRLRVLLVGDSSAVGVGVDHQRDALAGQLMPLLAKACGARIEWRVLARSGLTSAQTLALLQDAGPLQVDLAVLATGVNDVVDQVPSHHAVAQRDALVNWLRNASGVQHVVVCPLPPIHHFPGLPQPLRWVAGADARRHNHALKRWCGQRSDVSLVDMQMPLDASVMAHDGFHPGRAVYRHCAHRIAQHVAKRVWPMMQLA
jgi:lysophospholipase L1-like esterase